MISLSQMYNNSQHKQITNKSNLLHIEFYIEIHMLCMHFSNLFCLYYIEMLYVNPKHATNNQLLFFQINGTATTAPKTRIRLYTLRAFAMVFKSLAI